MEQLEGTNASIFNSSLWVRTWWECARVGKIHDGCETVWARSQSHSSPPQPPFFFSIMDHLPLFMSSTTLHTFLSDSVIKASQISPYHTHTEIYFSYQSPKLTCHRRLTKKKNRVRIKCLRFTLNLTFNCKLIIHPGAECSVLSDQRAS